MSAEVTEPVWGHTDDLPAVLDQIWESFTEVPQSLDFSPESFDVPAGTPLLDAHVQLLGRWQGRVQLICAASTAQQIASRILATPVDDLETEDVLDALGEITNIIGGNVKSLLSSVERLSLPAVDPITAPIAEPAGRVVDRCVAAWQQQPVLVQITALS